MSHTQILSDWVHACRYEDIPEEVIANTRMRVLDVIGLALAGLGTEFGQSVRKSVLDLEPDGGCHIIGAGDATSVCGAAFANGSLSQALEFDDTHNRSIVHMSGPAVAAALALAERNNCSGRELITAIAIGNELSCRIGSVAPRQFHRRGFHPTGLFASFGTTWLAGKLLGSSSSQMTSAAGIVGSFAAGLLQCWVDGTQSKFLHPGWAAQCGITAATLGQHDTTGPVEVLEGRFGLFASHLQDASVPLDYNLLLDALGTHWESENASFKPYPVAHVIHPYIDALLRLRERHNIDPGTVKRITCPVADYIVGIVCEPLHEKRRPNTDSHGRVSLQYTLAEALVLGNIDKYSYARASLQNPDILRIADLVEFHVDASFPGPEQFKAQVAIELIDGQLFTEVEEHNRGSRQNPMSNADIIGKFTRNAEGVLDQATQQVLLETVLSMDKLQRAADIIDCTRPGR